MRRASLGYSLEVAAAWMSQWVGEGSLCGVASMLHSISSAGQWPGSCTRQGQHATLFFYRRFLSVNAQASSTVHLGVGNCDCLMGHLDIPLYAARAYVCMADLCFFWQRFCSGFALVCCSLYIQ